VASEKEIRGKAEAVGGCEEASRKTDVISVAVDKCAATPSQDTIAIISQDGDSVTFSISQRLIGCDSSEELSWMATDFVDQDDEIVCLKESHVKCGHMSTYTAQCVDGMAAIDLFAHDGNSDLLKQTDSSGVSVPDACGAAGDEKKICHFRYLLYCMPSKCKGQETKISLRKK
jgi:hypothetical protein